jgi:hypothetical protein
MLEISALFLYLLMLYPFISTLNALRIDYKIKLSDLRLNVENDTLRLTLPSEEAADLLSDVYPTLNGTHFGIELIVGGEVYDHIRPGSFIKARAMESEFMRSHSSLLSVLTESATYYVHSRSDGYRCLDVAPRLGNHRVLYKPIDQILGEAIDPMAHVVEYSRLKVILDLLEINSVNPDVKTHSMTYTHEWQGRDWGKVITASLWGEREVVTITRSRAEQACWQDEFWRARASA